MQPYRNLGGNSGVVGYEFDADSIRIEFSDGSVYVYTDVSAGAYNLERMKQLARDGQGLHSFINMMVRHGYAYKER